MTCPIVPADSRLVVQAVSLSDANANAVVNGRSVIAPGSFVGALPPVDDGNESSSSMDVDDDSQPARVRPVSPTVALAPLPVSAPAAPVLPPGLSVSAPPMSAVTSVTAPTPTDFDDAEGDVYEAETASDDEPAPARKRKAPAASNKRAPAASSSRRKSSGNAKLGDVDLSNGDLAALYGLRRSVRGGDGRSKLTFAEPRGGQADCAMTTARPGLTLQTYDNSDDEDEMPPPPSRRRKGKARAGSDDDDDSDASGGMTPPSEQYDEGSDDSDAAYGAVKRKPKRPTRKQSTRNRLIQLAAGFADDSDSGFRASSRGGKTLNYNEDAMGTDFEDSDEDEGSGVVELDAAEIESACDREGALADGADNGDSIDGVCDWRRDPDRLDDKDDKPFDNLQYLIKWAGYSHLHNTWQTYKEGKSFRGAKRLDNYIKQVYRVLTDRRKLAGSNKEELELVEIDAERARQHLEGCKTVERIVDQRNAPATIDIDHEHRAADRNRRPS